MKRVAVGTAPTLPGYWDHAPRARRFLCPRLPVSRDSQPVVPGYWDGFAGRRSPGRDDAEAKGPASDLEPRFWRTLDASARPRHRRPRLPRACTHLEVPRRKFFRFRFGHCPSIPASRDTSIPVSRDTRIPVSRVSVSRDTQKRNRDGHFEGQWQVPLSRDTGSLCYWDTGTATSRDTGIDGRKRPA